MFLSMGYYKIFRFVVFCFNFFMKFLELVENKKLKNEKSMFVFFFCVLILF